MGMLGGAAQGSFSALGGDLSSFNASYIPLRHIIQSTNLNGLDLDVEEAMSLGGIIRLVDRLTGPSFIITLTPVATALQNQQTFSGFDHEVLEKRLGHRIS